MPKKKKKKQIKRKIAKKRARKPLGKRIKVKLVNGQQAENIYGAALATGKEIMPDFDFSEAEQAGSEENLAAETNIELAPELSVEPRLVEEELSEDYDEPLVYDQEEDGEPEPFENLTPRQKNIIMYVAITCIMAVVVSFWVLGLKASLSQSFKEALINGDESQKIKESLNGFKSDISDFKNQIDNQRQAIDEVSQQAKQKILEQQLKNTIVERIKEQVTDSQNNNLNVNAPSTNTK